jgi:hypothetical protein
MTAGRRCRFAAALALVGVLVPLAASKDLDPSRQIDEQKKIKARIDGATRDSYATLSAMRYQRLTPDAEQRMLRDVADGLKGLSQTEVKAVLEHLEKAVKAPDPRAATAEQKAAYEKHVQVVQQLKVMLGQLDVIKNLDEAAERLERAAEKQIKLITEANTNSLLPARRGFLDDREELATEQADLRTEVIAVFKQVKRLADERLLTPEQLARVQSADAPARGARLSADMQATPDLLRRGRYPDADAPMRRHAKELKDLAAALRTPPGNKIDALKAAKAQVEKAIDAQTKVNNETAEKNPDVKAPKGVDPKAARANQLQNQQTKAEFAQRDARKAAEQAAPEVADKLRAAESQQWKAGDKLQDRDIAGAREPEEKALESLKAAKDELDRQIAAAELAKTDPLAATKQAAEQLDKIIKEQKDANKQAAKAAERPERTPDAAKAQKDVARKTDELRNTPLPPNTEARQALDKALDAQKQAAEKLDNKQPSDAKPNQQQALKELEKAKEELEKQAKAIEERRAEIAKLEDLKGKLEELARNEKEVAKSAQKAADDPKKPDTGDIAKKQDDLTPPTKDVGKELEQVAPDAAKKVNEANMKQEGAKSDLAMNMPMMGGEKAKEAADKLADAAKDVQKQIDQKKGQEAADQAALQPNKVDPQQAAQQLAKAIEQAKMAEQQAKAADMALNPQQPMTGDKGMQQANMNDKGMQAEMDLAKLQKEIAKQAADKKLPDAAKAADKAAEALEKGDLPQAIQNQEKALEALQKAGDMQPMGMTGEKGMQPGDKGMQPGDKGMNPADKGMMGEKGMQPGDKGMQPGDKGMQPGDKGMQPGDKGMQSGDKGMMGMGEKGMGGMGDKGDKGMQPGAKGELAQQQQKVLEATKALQQSQQANAAAQAALQQAQANAPMAVQGQLQQAGQQLQQAGQQLQQGQPGQAGMNQQQAAQNLQQALDALNQAAMAQGQPGAQPGMGQMAMAGMGMMGMGMGQMGMGMGMGMAQAMGMGQGMGMGMGMGQMGMGMGMGMGNNAQQAQNRGMGEGDMQGGEKLKNVGSSGNAATGDGSFIKMRGKERDKVQQAGGTQFPAEFRELIKQYNINIKNGKPSNTPPAPGK